MALLFIDGFDHYDPQALDAFGEPWLARGKAAYLSPQATRINGRRPSSYALRLPAGSGGGYVRNLAAAGTSMIVGAALRVVPFENTGVSPLLLGVRDTTGQVAYTVRIAEDGRLRLYRGEYELLSTSVATAPARGWHYVELQVVQGTSNGTLQVRLNGILAITLSAQNTTQGGGLLVTAFLGAVPGQACPLTLDVDDFYIADTTGTINNSFLGDVRVDVLKPDGAGTHNQFTVTGAPTAWQACADDDEATFVTSTALAQRQTFSVQNLPVMATPAIHGVQVTVLARKTDAGNVLYKALALSGASLGTATANPLTEQLAWQTALFERNPNGNVQWTESAVNAAEFGLESA